MITQLFNEYRAISYLVLMQSTVVGFGTLATGTMVKVWRSAVEQGEAVYSPLSLMVQDYGFTLLLIPAVWATVILYRLRRKKSESSGVISGVSLLILFFAFFLLTATFAARFPLPSVRM